MNKPPEEAQQNLPVPKPSGGPNLVVLYSLIAAALLVAIGLAALIVLPFYQRR